MCGICGVIGLPASQARPATERMARAMIHRGPDDEGFEEMPLTADPAGPTAAFGFRRLAILDLSPTGHQPMVNRATGDVLIFNGEIYNFRELRARLQTKGRVFRSTGDTEVVLQALAEWGEAALDEFDGMFAIAFYRAADRRVLLARGPLGIKPLYVAAVPGAFVFASEVRAVLASGLVPTELDPAGIATFFAYGAPQDPLTVHRHVKSLPAGAYEWIGLAEAQGRPRAIRRYWRFPAIDRGAPGGQVAVARIRELLADAVRRQCVADVPVGVFLSAGIDSATIAALAQPQHGAVSTFSVGFEAKGPADETALAAETAAALRTRHFQTIVDDEWAIGQFLEWLRSSDRPSVDGLNTFIVSGAAKDRDITVVLSGLGADEVFAGYPIFRYARRLQSLLKPFGWVPQSIRRAAAAAVFAPLPANKRQKAVEMVARGATPCQLAVYSRRIMLDRQLCKLGFSVRTLGLTTDFLPPEAEGAFAAVGDCVHDVSQAEIALYMGNTLLRDGDINSMAHSLELRVPFLARDLIDYACSLPSSIRLPPGSQPKPLLRAAIKDRLPRQILDRPKTGFSLPMDDWMRGPLREICEAAVDGLACEPSFDGHAVRQLWKELHNRRLEHYYWRRLSMVVLGNYLTSLKNGFTAKSPVKDGF